MADVNANIGVNIDASDAISQLKSLQRQLSQFHTSIAKSSEAAALAQRDMQRNLVNSINSIGTFSAELRTIKTTAESFTDSLERNKFSMREYFRYAAASTKTFGKFFQSELATISSVAEDRVKRLQTQYIKMGRDATGAMKAIAVIPNELDLTKYSTQVQLAAQRQAIFSQLLKQGSTNLLNFGKNTQWAGRQLMVGFTIPLGILANTATRTFMEMETAAIKFKKVYGDLFTPAAETKQALEDVQALGQSFTRYGIAVSQTVGLAAEAAAAGFQGLDLQRQVTEATRLQVLGQVEQQKALETTISLQNAFRMSSEDLSGAINFLNAVENQTVVSLDDITTAIPKAAPIVRELGGDVKDLAFFMAAMKEGGINASEGANALKSGLASLINPTDKAREMMQGFGIDIDAIVNKNAGNVKQTVIEFAQAIDGLTDLNRQRAIEQLFGKFQQARLSALFDNVIRGGNQAARVLQLAGTSTEELAALAENELGITADSAMNKFRKSVEDLKLTLVPVGEVFLQTVTPIIESIGNILERFNDLSPGVKKAITVLTVAIGAIGPVALMTFGLIANGIANAMKFVMLLRNGYLRLTGQSQILGEQTQYLNNEQLEAAAVAHSLNQSHARLTQTFNVEAGALNQLTAAYAKATSAAQSFAFNNPGMMLPRGKGKKYAQGVVSVPGPKGAGDVVPAMLSPGEAVIPTKMAKKYAPLIDGMIAGNIPGFQEGRRGAYWTAAKRNELLDALGLTGDQRARIPLEATSAAYSVSGVMAPRAVNRETGLGMTPEYLKSDLGRAATIANLEVGLEDLGLSSQRMAEVLDDVSPQITKAIDEWDGSLQGWQKSSRAAMDTIQQSAKITAAEKDVIRRRFAPVNPDDYTVGSNLVTEVSRRRATTRNERVDAQRAYGSERQIAKLRARGFDVGPGFDYAHMPGYEKIPAGSVRVNNPTVAGLALSAQQQQTLAQEKAAFEKFRKEQDAMAAKNANSAVTATARAAGTQSPSKKTIPIGEDIARGLEVGMANRTDDVARSGQNLANAAVSGTRRARRGASSAGGTVGAGGIIIPPVIPPVGGGGTGGGTQGPGRGPITDSKILRQAYRQNRFNKIRGAVSRPGVGMAASTGVFAASMMPGKVGEVAQAAMPAVFGLQALQMALKLPIPHIKLFAGVLLAGVGIVKLINAARERERMAIEGLADAATLTKDKLQTLGDFFGVAPTTTPFETDLPQLVTTTQERTQLEQLKGSEGFQKNFAKDIQALKGATAKEAELVFKSLAIELQGKGFATEQVQTIINALREEAGKTDVEIDVKSLKLNTKGGQAELKKTADDITNQFATTFKTGFEEKMTLVGVQGQGGRGYAQWVNTMVPTKQLQRQSKAAGAEISNLINGISGQFRSGQISADDFNKSFTNIEKSVKALNETNPEAAMMLMSNVMATLPEKARAAAAGIKSVDGNMLLLKMQALGLTSNLVGVAEALKTLENPLADVSDKVKAQLLIDKTVKDVVAKAKTIEEALKKAYGAAGGGTGKETAFSKAIVELTDQRKAIYASIKAFNLLKQGGIDTARAFELSKNPLIAMALAAAKTKKEVEAILKLAKQLDKAADKDAIINKITELKNTREVKQALTGIASQLKSMGLEASDIENLLSNPDVVRGLTDGMISAADRAKYLQKLVNEITAAKIVDIQFRLVNDPMSLISETASKAQEYFSNMEDYHRSQMESTAEWQATVTAINEANDAIAKGESDIADYQSKINDLEYQLKYDPKIGDQVIADIEKQIQGQKDLIAAEEKKIQDIEKQIAAKQELIDKEQAAINLLEASIDKEQEKIDAINKEIDGYENIIEQTQRLIEMEIDRPLQKLQDESDILSNTLELIGKQEDEINKAYDKRQDALENVAKLNDQINNQKKQQISLADALTQGDIGAAAQIMQDMRASNAEAALESQQSLLERSRKQALEGITVNGMTRAQIEERQFQISQKIFDLEQKRKPLLAAIVVEEDKIYNAKLKLVPIEAEIERINGIIKGHKLTIAGYEKEIEGYNNQIKTHKLAIEGYEKNIEGYEKSIRDIEIKREELNDKIRDHQKKIDDINRNDVEPAKVRVQQQKDIQDAMEKSLKALVDSEKYRGLAKTDWDAIQKSIAAGKLDGELLAKATAAMQADVAAMVDKWANMPPVKNLTVNVDEYITRYITEVITQIVNQVPGDSGGGGGGGAGGGAAMLSSGGMVKPKYFARGGKALGSDTVPAMLTPGEFVVNRAATQRFRPLLEQINNGSMSVGNNRRNKKGILGFNAGGLVPGIRGSMSTPNYGNAIRSARLPSFSNSSRPSSFNIKSGGNSSTNNSEVSSPVYNYSVNVSVNSSNADANTIANVVIGKIQGLEAQNIRGQATYV